MRNIKIALQYEGTRYLGWQRLKDQDNTIQGKLEDLLNKMTDEEVQVIGCSRTDKGVHAKSLIANFHTNSKMTLHEIQTYMNYYLPEDIRVTYIEEVDDKFHARHNAKIKVYRFTIDNNSFADVFTRKTAIHQPKQLDIKSMEKTVAIRKYAVKTTKTLVYNGGGKLLTLFLKISIIKIKSRM